ncbi:MULTISPECIES: cob(I)yrinic acid a,c-diamide adenosyltransferase [Sphingomonas]|jgi:cob(I)alamin adenosyltransferase|uniref:Corrinoid adenosyltransferase n=1 Tax=Sphingomonas hankookensis TaxID=563996 RepID=A0ABR5Y9M9_9SPHN|nr:MULTISPECIES: cob(I)yrinic acid a,c-diamide adenosyltransferase [Sphingomonas]KZE11496.1 cob(I)yrinic acid a,c-diamide adenosyltransferase [Sphingomonas hankookensis]PZT94120.1 MAG: cob(I)yrinic acid a,c-diamide adenosyltransferase [Sphingomonas sp.]RSV30864.1 cob(I)yrinic acid a,c-diamide adenosyltransferase [Sphingomonas sp. ABOLH]WCP72226.1 cob(I)yrinic acid a,c-diamide adenosyltransferase [Sphingomonas hankookensis]
MTETPDDYAKHNARMQRMAVAREKMQARRTLERGLLIVHTGNGKGKSSSAFGMAIRSIGWGMKVAILQYVKGKWETGERNFFDAHPDLASFEVMGEGFTWETQDRAQDIAAARAAWERSKEMILDPAIDFVILDELNIVLRDDTLPIAEIVAFLKDRPLTKHICITGRNAKPELLELADLVTEFGEVKHPYHAGFKAQKGVEY